MRLILLILLYLSLSCLSGCTIVNLAPPKPDDGLLQSTLERYAGSYRESTND